MSLIPYTDEVLHKECLPFDFLTQSYAPKDLAKDLMREKSLRNGYGLAAPQIGVPYRVFAFMDEVAFNPRIIETETEGIGDGEILATEGCLSYPGLWITLRRPVFVKVWYQLETEQVVERWLNKLESRVFQHELDHLDGITMIDKASDLKLRRAIDQANKHGYNYEYAKLRGKV